MFKGRTAGILLHPTSLPGPFGIGDLGPDAHRWIDWMASTGSAAWQVLPLGPTGYGDSPYQSFSSFAGNPYLISPASLLADNLIDDDDLAGLPEQAPDRVDFGSVIPWKLALLRRAFARFQKEPPPGMADDLSDFRLGHAHWLEDYALFMALKEEKGGRSWLAWPASLRRREPRSMERARARLAGSVDRHVFTQYLFFRQWGRLRAHAAGRGIRIIGDIPIFTAVDSADVWAHPGLFRLDADRKPTVVAGVPPDYFSKRGQLWGNPLYRWEDHRRTGYRWWISRIRSVIELVDVARIDHFRGFVDCWEIPAGAGDATAGRWVDGPGRDLFDHVAKTLGELPIIAEDLGEIHAAVTALRDELGLPGMKVLQFAFDGDPENAFLPHRYPENCVAYTGTHDNDTTAGWWHSASEETRRRACEYLDVDGADIVWDLLRAGWHSAAQLAVAPIQDFLELGTEARMNTPAARSGNWTWRMRSGDATAILAERIRRLNETAGRGEG